MGIEFGEGVRCLPDLVVCVISNVVVSLNRNCNLIIWLLDEATKEGKVSISPEDLKQIVVGIIVFIHENEEEHSFYEAINRLEPAENRDAVVDFFWKLLPNGQELFGSFTQKLDFLRRMELNDPDSIAKLLQRASYEVHSGLVVENAK